MENELIKKLEDIEDVAKKVADLAAKTKEGLLAGRYNRAAVAMDALLRRLRQLANGDEELLGVLAETDPDDFE